MELRLRASQATQHNHCLYLIITNSFILTLIIRPQQIPLRRLSADQHRCDHLVYRLADRCVFAVFMLLNLLHQKLYRFRSEHIDLLSHGADREDGVSGGGGVVEADDQIVFRESAVFSY